MTALAILALVSPGDAPQFLRTPSIHGDQIVFTSEDDLWVGSLSTGKAVRLTADAGHERNAQFSPDGTKIAFEGEYDGLREAYVMPSQGGAPRRLTLTNGFRAVTGWTPDGKDVVFRRFNTPTNYAYLTVPAVGGAPVRVPLEFASHISYGSSQESYAFTRFNRWSMAWFRYEGGMSNQVWWKDSKGFRQITSEAGTCEYPVVCGDRVYYVVERDATFMLKSVAPAGGGARVETGPFDVEMRELDTDGKRIVLERGVGADIFDPTTKSLTPIKMVLTGDDALVRPYQVEAQDYLQGASPSPAGKRVLAEVRGQLASLPVGDGEARLWKRVPGARLRYAQYSPDGKKVAYVSDETGQPQIWVSNADGTDAKRTTSEDKCHIVTIRWSPDSSWISYCTSTMDLKIVKSSGGPSVTVANVPFTWYGATHDWSKDSKWIVFRQTWDITGFGAVTLYDVTAGRTTTLGTGRADDTAPAFSSDGRFIVFVSQRELSVTGDAMMNQLNLGRTNIVCLLPLRADIESPFVAKDTIEPPTEKPAEEKPKDEAFKIVTDGLYDRRIELPIAGGSYVQVAMVGNRVIMAGDGQITFYDIEKKSGGSVANGGSFILTADHSKIMVDMRVIDVTAENVGAGGAKAGFGGLKLDVEPAVEWRQMFWDAWRLLRDYFYVANMHGVDWDSTGAKYAAYLPSVRSREDLDELIRWMQGELGSSHQYLGIGDARDIKPRFVPGFLGIDLEPRPDGSYVIGKVIRGDGFRTGERSPLADPALKIVEGMTVVEIAGVPTRVGNDVYRGLVGRAGQVVGVTVKDGGTIRKVFVKPVPDETRMRQLDWVESNRKYVEKASDGRVGYIYLRAMGNDDMSDFVRQYFAQRDKSALLVDVRFNNGGYVQDFINRILSSKLTGFFNMRNSREPWTRQQDYFAGPMACLINEFSISCGEEFPHRFRDLGIGALIGRRTMGGEVGSSPGWPLIDGGTVNVPNYGMYVPGKGWDIEGPGVSPDIDVPSDPNAYVAGRDPQLDAGVKRLLADLAKAKPLDRMPPRDRVRAKKG